MRCKRNAILLTHCQFTSDDINVLEAKAVTRALETFHDLLADAKRNGAVDAIRIVVDNTSVQSSAKRGVARSEELNYAMVPLLRNARALQMAMTFEYIATKKNPSDAISRGLPWQEDLLKQALGELKTRDGEGRAGTTSRVVPFARVG